MNTTIDTQSKLENNVKYSIHLIINVLWYLYNMRVPFNARMGLKSIYQSLERHPISKEITQRMKDFYESVDMKPHASGEYPVPENLAQYQYLEFVEFTDDCCSFKPKAVENLNSIDAKLHAEAVIKYQKIHQKAEMEKFFKSYDLEVPEINIYASNLLVTRDAPANLEDITLNIPEISDGLPFGARIIKYRGTLYFYVTSPCMLQLVLNYTNEMHFEFTTLFYKTCYGGILTTEEAKYEPPCENLPGKTYFEVFPDAEMALAIFDFKDYVTLIELGIYQKYKHLKKWNRYDLHVNHYFGKPTIEQIDKFFKGYTVSQKSILSYEDLVSYVKNDVQDIVII